MLKQWNYYQPTFEYAQTLEDIDFPWTGHRYFIYDLVRNFQPRQIVELGTFYGTSFFSMCQAIKDGGLKTSAAAVDTWEGDKHAGFYEDKVYNTVSELKQKYYSKLDITLLRMTFDEALAHFKKGSIDLLHIDGLHTYQAVKHDFETWLPKVSKKGIIVMHDIVEKRADFGVYKLWAEIKKKYPTMEFVHSHGLGVIILDPKAHQFLANWQDPWKQYYSHEYEDDKNAQHFMVAIKEHDRLKQEITEKQTEILLLKHDLKAITSTKFFALWQTYVKLKKALMPWKNSAK